MCDGLQSSGCRAMGAIISSSKVLGANNAAHSKSDSYVLGGYIIYLYNILLGICIIHITLHRDTLYAIYFSSARRYLLCKYGFYIYIYKVTILYVRLQNCIRVVAVVRRIGT